MQCEEGEQNWEADQPAQCPPVTAGPPAASHGQDYMAGTRVNRKSHDRVIPGRRVAFWRHVQPAAAWRNPYGGVVRWTSRSWLWGLLAALLFGLVLMHHVPSHGGHDPELAAVPTAAVGSGMAMTENHAAQCPCPAAGHDAPLPGGGGESGTTALLHLCLAVLAALGGMLAAGLMLRGFLSQTGGNAGSAGRRIGLEYLRPPIPVSRRLAALCVLRL